MTRTDRIVLLFCLAIAAGLFLAPRTAATFGEDRMLQIELSGRIVRRVNFLPDGQTATIPVALPRGKALISLEKGGARILPLSAALCPQGVCSHAGLIDRPGQRLICAPNKLVVRVTGDRRRTIDAVAR